MKVFKKHKIILILMPVLILGIVFVFGVSILINKTRTKKTADNNSPKSTICQENCNDEKDSSSSQSSDQSSVSQFTENKDDKYYTNSLFPNLKIYHNGWKVKSEETNSQKITINLSKDNYSLIFEIDPAFSGEQADCYSYKNSLEYKRLSKDFARLRTSKNDDTTYLFKVYERENSAEKEKFLQLLYQIPENNPFDSGDSEGNYRMCAINPIEIKDNWNVGEEWERDNISYITRISLSFNGQENPALQKEADEIVINSIFQSQS